MTAERQYVRVQFPNSSRTYTYHNDGPPLAVGQAVKAETRHGWVTAEVVELVEEQPPFDTKPVTAKEAAA